MRIGRSRCALVSLVVAGCAWAHVFAGGQQQGSADPTVPDLLAAAGRYVADYEKNFGAIAADERYVQTANSAAVPAASKREMNCAVLMFNTGEGGWMAFRDVLSVDRQQISSDSGRLAALAANPTREALVRAMKATEASRSFFLGQLRRPFVIAPAGLVFLRAEQQSRSTFEFDGMKTVGKTRVAVLKFEQRAAAQMIATGEQSTVSGRLWIEPGTGRVAETEITIEAGSYQTRTQVEYASAPGVDIWVPVRLMEQYDIKVAARASSAGMPIGGPTSAYADGLSTYSNFRRFEAKPELQIRLISP